MTLQEEEDDSFSDNLPSNFEIPVIPASELTYERALKDFFIPNLPFVISDATATWSSQKDWIISHESFSSSRNSRSNSGMGGGGMLEQLAKNGKEEQDATKGKEEYIPNWDFLSRNYGEFRVNVLQCKVHDEEIERDEGGESITCSSSSSIVVQEESCQQENDKVEQEDENDEDEDQVEDEEEEEEEYGSGEMSEMTFNQVIELWKDGKGKGLYIKDWHLPLQVKERANLASTNEEDNTGNAQNGSDDVRHTQDTSRVNNERTDDNEQTDNNEQTNTNEQRTHIKSGKSQLKEEQEEEEKEKEEQQKQYEKFYETPNIFKNDWMNNYYSNNTKDDFTFVYFGSKGTFTPLHCDVYTSYSWSANILGRKSWYLIPPSSIRNCRKNPNDPKSSLRSDFIRLGKLNNNKYPNSTKEKVKIFNIIQEKGSIIYIPSNWYHSVLNLDNFVISINKNWCNEINLIKLFKSINISIEEIRNSLKDDILYVLKRRKLMLEIDLDIEMEFENIIQDVLIKNVGWGWETFYSMIRYNLLHPPAPPYYSPPRSILKSTLSAIFSDHESQSRNRLRCKSYDSALEVALSIINEKI